MTRVGIRHRSSLASPRTTAKMIATFPPLTAVRCESPDARIASSRESDCSDSSPTDKPATSAAALGSTPSRDSRSPSRIADAAVSTGPGARSAASSDPDRIVSTAAMSDLVAGLSLPDTAISVPGAGTRAGSSTLSVNGRSTSTSSPRADTALVAIRTSVEVADCQTAADPSERVTASPLTTAITDADALAADQPAIGSAVIAQT